MFARSQFRAADAVELAEFLNHLRRHHWSLTSLGYQRRPASIPLASPRQLIEADLSPGRLGTFLLRKEGRIIAALQVDQKYDNGRVAVFSGVETHPEYQRRGTFWRQLGDPCLRLFCQGGFERIEAITWSFNRKGIPLYKRVGFRAVSATSLIMENYLPLILRHPAAAAFFARCDFIRALQNRRSYGYDDIQHRGMNLFEYHWQSGADALHLMVDRTRRQIVCLGRPGWCIWCFTAAADPFRLHYEVANTGRRTLRFWIRMKGLAGGRSPLYTLLPEGSSRGDIYLDEFAGRLEAPARVEFELENLRVPFVLRPFASGRGGTGRVREKIAV